MPQSKKLSLSSAIFLSLTSMVGAGIFIKTQTLNTLSHRLIAPTIFLFFIFLLNIFVFTYVLVKIIPSQTGNMGFMEWSRKFCSKTLDACFTEFMRFFYHPVSLVIFSVYGVFGILGDRVGIGVVPIMFLSFAAVLFFMTINLVSFKWAKKLQFILWVLVLIPLISLPIIGIANRPSKSDIESLSQPLPAQGLDSIGPWMLLISGLPSVLFIYDGFYNLASLKDRLKSPKILSVSLVVSFVLVTILYLYVIIGFNVGNPVSADYKGFVIFSERTVLKELFEICVGCASFLTLNSIALSNIPQLVAMNKANSFVDVKKFERSFFYKKNEDYEFQTRLAIWMYLIFKTFVWFCIVCALALFLNKFRKTGDGLRELMDSLADIVSVFVFGILATIIVKSLKKLKHLEVSRMFKFCAITSSSLIAVAIIYLILSYLVGSFGYAGSSISSSLIKVFLLLVFFVGSFRKQIYLFFDRIWNRKKYLLYSPKKDDWDVFTLS